MNELYVLVRVIDGATDKDVSPFRTDRVPFLSVYGNSKGRPFNKDIDARRARTMRGLTDALVVEVEK